MAESGLHLLWRDERTVVVYKPAGWLVHRTALDAHETRWVVQSLRDQLGQTVYPVHRLDKGTCGVLLLALDADAARQLCQAFEGGQVHKRYLAVVRGWPPHVFRVDHALRPDDAHPHAPAQPAVTEIRCLATLNWPEAFDPRFASTRLGLVEAQPLTGRRHQIRRHLKHVAHPIVGDATHDKGPLNRWWAERLGLQRLWLHAWSLRWPHPETGALIEVNSGVAWPPCHVDRPGKPALNGLVANSLPSASLKMAPENGDWKRMLSLPWQSCDSPRSTPI